MSSDLGKKLLDAARKASAQDASSPQKATKTGHEGPAATDIGMLAPGLILTATDGSKGKVPSSSSPAAAFKTVRLNDQAVFLDPDEVEQRQLPQAKATSKNIEKQNREYEENASKSVAKPGHAETLTLRQKYLPKPVPLGTAAVAGLAKTKPNLDTDGKDSKASGKKQPKASSAKRQVDHVSLYFLSLAFVAVCHQYFCVWFEENANFYAEERTRAPHEQHGRQR